MYIEYTERGDNKHVILMQIESLDSQIPCLFEIYFGDFLSCTSRKISSQEMLMCNMKALILII